MDKQQWPKFENNTQLQEADIAFLLSTVWHLQEITTSFCLATHVTAYTANNTLHTLAYIIKAVT